ncbi:pyruvate dehydrogenase (acetyl-transferring) kinase, mitochondrial [Tanacetum coccineum]
MPKCSWRGHLRGIHIHYCPGVLGGDTYEGYIFITARVFLEGTPAMGTYGFYYCPGVLGGDTYDGYIVHQFHELRCMTRSSTSELFTPYKEPEREFRSSRRHFKTLSLDELRSHDFNLLSDQEYLEEEVAETMAETMEQYISKTRADYGHHEDANEHIEKVLEIVDLFHIPNITIDQVMLRAFPMSLTGDASRWLRNEPTSSITTWDGLKTKFLNKYCPPAQTAKKMEEINNFQQEPDENLYQAWERFKELLMNCPQHYLMEMHETAANAKIAIQKMAEYSQKWHNGTSRSRSTETSDGLVAIQAQLNNLGREIKKVNEKVYAAQVGCEQCKGTHYTKDCPLKEEGKTLEEAYYTQFGRPFQGGGYKAAALGFYQRNNVNPLYQERRQSMEDTLSKFMSESAKRHEENSNLIKEIRASTDAAIRNQGASIKTLEIQIGQMSKVLQERGFGSLPSSTKAKLRDQVKSISTTIEADSHLIRHFIILDMPKDIKVPLILERPFSSIARAKIDIYKRKITLRVREERIVFTSVKSASSLIKRVYMLSLRERMELDLKARLMGETLVLNSSLDPFLEDYIELNDLNEPFELRRNQGDDLIPTIEESEVIKEFRTRDDELNIGIDDYPSYCDYDKKIHIDYAHNLKFSCMIGFEFTHANFFPLLYVNVMSKKFHNSIMKDKMVYNGNNVVGALINVSIFVGTFSVVTDFAFLENMDAYRGEGMSDVSKKDEMNGIPHGYQKLKGFYKGVLNLGPDYIRDAKMEEWLTHGHISVHEME